MILCLDVGNTQIYGGVFHEDKVVHRFRVGTRRYESSDELGVFLRSVIREKGIEPNEIMKVGICSVVPSVDYALRSACVKYFKSEPFFLKSGVKTGLKVLYNNPHEVGADNIANAVAALEAFPGKNVVVGDFGTATVFCATTKEGGFLGGTILPGFRVSMEALSTNAAKLMPVEIVKPENVMGKTTVESIQAGLYYSQLGAMKEITERFKHECFGGEEQVVIGTGGFARLFQDEGVFDAIVPDLPLQGMKLVMEKNGC